MFGTEKHSGVKARPPVKVQVAADDAAGHLRKCRGCRACLDFVCRPWCCLLFCCLSGSGRQVSPAWCCQSRLYLLVASIGVRCPRVPALRPDLHNHNFDLNNHSCPRLHFLLPVLLSPCAQASAGPASAPSVPALKQLLPPASAQLPATRCLPPHIFTLR